MAESHHPVAATARRRHVHPDRRCGDRRSGKSTLVFPERRTGFDRRVPHRPVASRYHAALIAYRRNRRLIALMLAHLVALNIADLVFTQYALARGAVEVNPVMARLFAIDPAVAAAVKIGVAFAVAYGIWRLRRYRRILELSITVVAAYAILFGYHLALTTRLG